MWKLWPVRAACRGCFTMIFKNPEWLLLLPVLALAGWALPRLRLLQPLRIILLLLLTLILIRPQWRKYENGLDLMVLLDRSSSTEDLVDKGQPEWKKLLEKSRRSGDDRAVYFDYATEVIRQGEMGAELYARNKNLTKTSMAIETALALASKTKPTRVLLFTDGYSTEPLTGLAEKLAAQNITLDYRLIRDKEETDWRVAKVSAPPRSQVAEPFLLEIDVRGTKDGPVPVTIYRDGRELKQMETELVMGKSTVRLTDRVAMPGAHKYEARITPSGDSHPGNNISQTWVEIAGGPRILLVTKYLNDPVASTLKKQGFTVDVAQLPGPVTLGQLAGAKAVILNNVPAFDLPNDFLRSLDFYVREQGGALLMAGGPQSFGSGGYFESPVDPLLPVSMELKTEHRKLSVAMAIIMDRSGSMAAPAGGGMAKMDLANEGSANAIQFLGDQDLLTVFAVDSEPHEMVPMQPVGGNRDKMMSAVRKISSTGGGIYVYTGLKAGWAALKDAAVGQRHLILFSDAADSEEPGDYKNLLKEMTDQGTTISVIALGTRSDCDAALLEDIASLGKGRIFFTDKPAEIPAIFSQETIAVARSAFIKENTGTQGTPGWFQISSQKTDWLPEVDGYNLSYLRDWATQGLATKDEYTAPLVAFGNRGIGRTAAVSFPLGGEFSQMIRAWPKYGDFLQTMARWLMGEAVPAGLGLRHELQGTTLNLDLMYDQTWEAALAEKAPRLVIASGTGGEQAKEATWTRLAPGHFHLSMDLAEGEMTRGAVQVGPHALTFGPVVVGGSTEWAFDPLRLQELRQLALSSGGGELLDLDQAWRSPPARQFTDIRTGLLILALLLMIAEALATRTGWRMPEFSSLLASLRALRLPTLRSAVATAPTNEAAAEAHRRTLDAAVQPTATAESPTAPPPVATAGALDDRASRFARAKRRP